MSDLWAEQRAERRRAAAPLAVRMRPRTLEEFVGQRHFLGPGKLLRRMLDGETLTSVLFHGPPGTGKTTLARLVATSTGRDFVASNAAEIGVKEVRAVIDTATKRLEDGGARTVLFLDEIHRFSKSQQDVMLGAVERGIVTLIGATTENPYYAVNSALVSRSTVFEFKPLTETDIIELARRAATDPRGFPGRTIRIGDDALEHWAQRSDGDARRTLNALEVAVLSQPGDDVHVDLACAEDSIQTKALLYDKLGDAHYDTISAFIKSMRASRATDAVGYLVRMLEAGEDPRFIARRIAIFASEDIGNADPAALTVANAAWTTTERVGRPECDYALTQATLYMAQANKSRAVAEALAAARQDVRETRTPEIPATLLNRTVPDDE